ncbi:MAG: energy-coupling factor ABC transporter permease [Bacillota bacterium]|jgi:cobalt/nickel transport system permease protein|nr:hypothetical protein [Bacillota bacterium]
MSHLHIPDGLLPLPIVAAGLAITAVLLLVASRRLARLEGARVAPRIAVLSALMLVAMGLPLPVLGYHVNLTVLTGIIAGPAAGFVAVFIANLILSLTAHGGITVLGLNALIGGVEVTLGWLLWKAVRRALPRTRAFAAAAIAVALALAVSTFAMLAVVASSGADPDLVLGGHVHAAEEAHREALATPLRTFAAVVLSTAAVGWAVEALVVGALVEFIWRVRPELLGADEGRGA